MNAVLSPAQAAAFLGVAESTVLRALREKRLPGRKLGARWVLSARQLLEWVEADEAPQAKGARSDPMRPKEGSLMAEVDELQRRRAS